MAQTTAAGGGLMERAGTLARHLAGTWAHAWRRLHCHREDPASGLLSVDEIIAEADTIARTEAALYAFQIEPEDIPLLADQPDPQEPPCSPPSSAA